MFENTIGFGFISGGMITDWLWKLYANDEPETFYALQNMIRQRWEGATIQAKLSYVPKVERTRERRRHNGSSWWCFCEDCLQVVNKTGGSRIKLAVMFQVIGNARVNLTCLPEKTN